MGKQRSSKRLSEHFTEWEMRCRCFYDHCGALPMNPDFMERLEALRAEWGKPISPTSARRCRAWNDVVGGAPLSMHLEGKAADFIFEESEAKKFAELAEKYGFGGIGLGKNLVHIDSREEKARWSYSSN